MAFAKKSNLAQGRRTEKFNKLPHSQLILIGKKVFFESRLIESFNSRKNLQGKLDKQYRCTF